MRPKSKTPKMRPERDPKRSPKGRRATLDRRAQRAAKNARRAA